ncbi:MarR family transcriptional regulator [Cutibacterium equinum]|uniref:MarR family transcriptional regulator n=1 Tax=Cutibacterium equinum TaxID=3016342 RepID=A0ABY7QXY2_9ACTN|nr:MarR family transcriptional regulator [Cutibacterium equinum]WCC79914.1 MarR family transcriptional regulator [Cutibacterium equinum]
MTQDRTVWLDDHQQRVWRLWLEVTTMLPAVLNRQLSRDSQLSMQDFEVLVRLSETDGGEMRVVALAEHMGWERSRLSHHLTRIEKRGLVERRICCTDGRGAIVHLTDQGMEALRQAAPGHASLVRRVVFGGLDHGHLDDLDTILTHIRDELIKEEKSQLTDSQRPQQTRRANRDPSH